MDDVISHEQGIVSEKGVRTKSHEPSREGQKWYPSRRLGGNSWYGVKLPRVQSIPQE